MSDARNYGIDRCNGEWITFVDSDDVVGTNYIGLLYRTAVKENSDISVIEYDKFNDVISECETVKHHEKKEFISSEIMELYFTDMAHVMTSAWGKMYKRQLFADIRYPQNKLHEDEFITYKLMNMAKKISYIPNIEYYYRQRKGSIINSEFDVKRLSVLEAYEERLKFINDFYPKIENRAYIHYMNRLIICYCALDGLFELDKNKIYKKFKEYYFDIRKHKLIFRLKLKFLIFYRYPKLYNKMLKMRR